MSCSCGHSDLGLEQLEVAQRAAVKAGHMTEEQAAVTIGTVRAAREAAQETITRLEPRHISGWSSLIHILEEALERARVGRDILGKEKPFSEGISFEER